MLKKTKRMTIRMKIVVKLAETSKLIMEIIKVIKNKIQVLLDVTVDVVKEELTKKIQTVAMIESLENKKVMIVTEMIDEVIKI